MFTCNVLMCSCGNRDVNYVNPLRTNGVFQVLIRVPWNVYIAKIFDTLRIGSSL